MQNFNKFNSSDYISDAPEKLNGNFQTVASDYAGTSFPTTDLVEGMTCYRTDEQVLYRYNGSSWVSPIATQAEAESGSNNTKVMTPKGVDYRLNKDRSLKTYTSFRQLGLSSTATLLEVVNAMPKECKFTQYISASTYEAFGVPSAGIITILKAQGVNYANLMHQSYGGTNSIRKVWFENWASGQTQFLWHEILSGNMFATQSQAEAGRDNTTVMTPKGVDYRLNKDRSLKTYNNLQSLGLTSSDVTLTKLIEALPVNSQFSYYADLSLTQTLGLPINGLLVILKSQGENFANLWLQSRGDDDNSRRAWYENWVKGQTSFNWQEVITYGDSGNTARTNLNLRLQTFTDLSQLGLTNDATPEDIAKALPENSEISFYAINAMKPTLGQPVNGSCRIEKRSTAGFSTVNFFVYAQTTPDIYYGVYSSYNNSGFSGWEKFAINGALSMPYTGAGGISISTSVLTGSGYTAPNDGWVAVSCTSTATNNGSWARIYNSARQALSVSQSMYSGEAGRLLFPVAKNGLVKMSKGENITIETAYFYPARSEV